MSTHEPDATASLPQLSPQRIDEIETALFADISRERSAASTRRTRRGRIWIAGGAAAAIVAVAAIIAPSVGSLVGGSAGGSADSAVAPAFDSGFQLPATEEASRDMFAADDAGGAAIAGETADRDIITTASATVTADDVQVAVRVIGDSAVAHGGYVESMSVGSDGAVVPIDPMTGDVVYESYPYPYTPNGAWITVRVPADELPAVVDELEDVGEVTASSINRQDVTEQTVDLQARIDAAQASVDRLTDLMGEATSVADLIAAEAALSERQALLESYQQQLKMLDDQVAMSTLSVTVVPKVETVTADPAGFADGLVAGWNGLVATLNGVVVALGFLIPWILVAGIVALIVWGIVRAVRSRRQRRADAAARPPASVGDDRE